MNDFPKTTVGGVSVSRMVIGTNWLLGFSHCTQAKDILINEMFSDYKKIADILEVFFRAGVNAIIGLIQNAKLSQAVKETEQRTGTGACIISTPAIPTAPRTPLDGFDRGQLDQILDRETELGAKICMPHAQTTDAMLDRCTRTLRKMDEVCSAIRERGMVPGLSTHMPEAIIYADESGLDVETYTSIFNSMGFLMSLEVDWTARLINDAKKPVLVIKPMAAGQIRPLAALTFAWNAIRQCDMVAVGTMTPVEAAELIEMSLGILERRQSDVQLQETRSKQSVKPAKKKK